jgi:hypothetical protein
MYVRTGILTGEVRRALVKKIYEKPVLTKRALLSAVVAAGSPGPVPME